MPERIHAFQKILANHDLYFFNNVEEAKKGFDLLGPFDFIFMDHDMDGRVYVPSDEPNTGYQLAKHIANKGTKAEIIIHSMNVPGADRILAELPQAKHIPFPTLIQHMKG
jgi:Cyclic-phosphate processing Receiver domain